MKIVQINAVYKASSTGRTTLEMHNALRTMGHESYVFCCNMHNPIDNVFRVGCLLDHKIHALCSRIFGLQGFFSFMATRRLIAHLRSISPDIVILRNLHNNYVNFPMLLKYLDGAGCGVIDVLHDCWSFTGHCSYYTKQNCSKWQKECQNCQYLSEGNKSYFFDNSLAIFRMKRRRFSKLKNLAVVGVSKWITNEAKKSPIFDNAKLIIPIYNWINLEVFKPREASELRTKLNIALNQFVVLGVSQGWSPQKGLLNFISIAKRMPDIMFVMVGNMAKNMTLPSNIISIPPTSSIDELCQYYSMADVFLNFSVQETFGKVTAEAVSCGTPVIVNDATATPELCGEGCGYIIHNNDEDAAISAIKIIESKGKGNYTDKCRKFAVDNFDMGKGIEKYMQVFQQLHGFKDKP